MCWAALGGAGEIPSVLALWALHAQSPRKAEFMTFPSTASLMHEPKYQQLDADAQPLGCLLLPEPCRGELTVSMWSYHLKPSRLGGGILTEQLAYFMPSPNLILKTKVW